jgi:hypothetical protein
MHEISGKVLSIRRLDRGRGGPYRPALARATPTPVPENATRGDRFQKHFSVAMQLLRRSRPTALPNAFTPLKDFQVSSQHPLFLFCLVKENTLYFCIQSIIKQLDPVSESCTYPPRQQTRISEVWVREGGHCSRWSIFVAPLT